MDGWRVTNRCDFGHEQISFRDVFHARAVFLVPDSISINSDHPCCRGVVDDAGDESTTDKSASGL